MMKVNIHLFFCFLPVIAAAQSVGDSIGFTNDLVIVKTALEKNHPSLYRFTSKEKFESVYDSLQRSITSTTTPYDFFRVLSKVEFLIREGHSYINRSPELSKAGEHKKILPFKITLVDDRIIVTESRLREYAKYVGSELLSINGKSTNTIVSLIENSTGLKSGFNNSGLKNILSIKNNFSFAYYYFVDTSETFVIRMKSPRGDIGEKRIAGEVVETKYNYPEYPIEKVPPFRFEILSDRQTAVLKITTFAYWIVNYSRKQYLNFFKECFAAMTANHIKNLIIDVRDNRGGDETIAAELLTYFARDDFFIFQYIKIKSLNFSYTNDLSDEKQFGSIRDYVKTDSGYFRFNDRSLKKFKIKRNHHFDGGIYVLANGGSRSAASIFLTLVKTYTDGKIIGQESGGIFKESDGYNRITFTLPYSHSLVSFPIWTLKVKTNLLEDPNKGVIPDYQVKKSDEDIISGTDCEMSYVMTLISR